MLACYSFSAFIWCQPHDTTSTFNAALSSPSPSLPSASNPDAQLVADPPIFNSGPGAPPHPRFHQTFGKSVSGPLAGPPYPHINPSCTSILHQMASFELVPVSFSRQSMHSLTTNSKGRNILPSMAVTLGLKETVMSALLAQQGVGPAAFGRKGSFRLFSIVMLSQTTPFGSLASIIMVMSFVLPRPPSH